MGGAAGGPGALVLRTGPLSGCPRSDSDEVDRISEWKRRDEQRRRELEARRRREQEEELRRLREREQEEKEEKGRRREQAERGDALRKGSGASSADELRDEDEPVRKQRVRKGRARGPQSSSDSEAEAELDREVRSRLAGSRAEGAEWEGGDPRGFSLVAAPSRTSGLRPARLPAPAVLQTLFWGPGCASGFGGAPVEQRVVPRDFHWEVLSPRAGRRAPRTPLGRCTAPSAEERDAVGGSTCGLQGFRFTRGRAPQKELLRW